MRRAANAGLAVLLIGAVSLIVIGEAVPIATGTLAVTIDRNSMQQVLPMGSLAYIQKQDAYEVGDIVTFRKNGSDVIVTHQIVEVLPNQATAALDGTRFVTKGTNNADADPDPLRLEWILGEVVGSVPYAGLAAKTIAAQQVQVFIFALAILLYYLGSKRPTPQAGVPSPA